MRGSGSSSRAIALWVAVVLAATGCQMLSPARPTARAVLRVAPAGVATGLIRLDMAKLRAAWAPRSLKTVEVPSSYGTPTTLRLTVKGPDMTEASASVPFETEQAAGAPLASLTLAVPAGQNRVFILEGMNADGKPVRRLMAAAAVVGGDPIDLEMSFLSDAVARVLAHLVADPALTASEATAFDALEGESLEAVLRSGTAPDHAEIVASLAGTDLVAALTTYIDQIVGYDEATNAYAEVDPGRFRARLLANLLRLDGAGLLTATPDERLTSPALGVVSVRVQDADGVAVPGAAAAIFDPYRPIGSPKSPGAFDFTDVASGTWTVVGTFDGKAAYGTVTVVDDVPTGIVTLTLSDLVTTPSPTPTPSATPTPAPEDLVVYEDTPAWSFLDTVNGLSHSANSVTELQTHALSNSGTAAIEVNVTNPLVEDPDGTAEIAFMAMQNGAFDASPYEALEVSVRGLAAGTEVVGSFLDSAGNTFGSPASKIVGTTYAPLRYDFSSMAGGMPGSIKGFVLRYRGSTVTTLYVDDIRFLYPGSPGYQAPLPPKVYDDTAPEPGWSVDDPTAAAMIDVAATTPVDAGPTAIVAQAVSDAGYLRFLAPAVDLKNTSGIQLSMNAISGTSTFNAYFLDASGAALGSPVSVSISAGYTVKQVTFAAASLTVLDIEAVRGIKFEVPLGATYAVDTVGWLAK